MPYIPFTEEQKLRANSVNLVEFLRRQGEKLIPSGRDKRLSSDHSITVRGNEWYDHESKEGGHAISFVQTYYGLTYPEAVKRLLDGEGVAYPQTVPSEPEKPKEFVLPPASPTMRQLYAYLLQQRFIDRDVLDAFTKRGMIYESCEKSRAGTKEYHNAVFVGSDEYGTARHAHKRSLYTQGNSFRRNVEGGDPRCSFHWFGNSGRLYVFEAPIDLLAFLTLYPEAWREHSYVALCGTSEQAMLWMLEKDPRIQRVVLCLDHDAAGIEATGRLTDILREHGHTRVSVLRPEYKDWDEDLKALNGRPAQPAEQHPQLQAAERVCARIAVKCMDLKPDGAMQQVPHLFQCYRKCLKEKKLETAMDCMEEIAALSLLVTLRECRQLGTIVQSITGQLQKNYGREGSEVIVDNCQVLISGGFAPASQTAVELSKALGSRTVMSGSISRGKNDPSQSLQMIERPLMTPDELKSMPKGSFIVAKTGVHPMQVRLRLFLDWGIKFDKSYEVPERAQRPVAYASKQELEAAILRKHYAPAVEDGEIPQTEPPASGGEVQVVQADDSPKDGRRPRIRR